MTLGQLYFQPQGGAALTGSKTTGNATYVSPVLTLQSGTFKAQNTDQLLVVIDDGSIAAADASVQQLHTDITAETSSQATASNQATEITSLGTLHSDLTGIAGLIPAQVNGTQPVTLMALNYPSSTVNSSVSQLLSNASFTGTVEDIRSLQAAQIEVTCDQPYTVTVYQYIDLAGTRVSSTDVFTRAAGQPLNENVTLPGNYFNIVVQNTGASTTTTLNINTTFGIMDTIPRTLSNLGNFKTAISEVGGVTVPASGIPVNAMTVAPSVLTSATATLFTTTGTATYKITPGGVYSFCASIHSATLGTTANNLTSCTTALGSRVVAYTGAAPTVGQLIGGANIVPGSYVTAVNAGTNFSISIPANAAGSLTLTVTAGYFSATMLSSSDGITYLPITTANPKTFARAATATGTAVAPGLWTYQSSPTDNYLRWSLNTIGVSGAAGNLTGNPTIRLNIDAFSRDGVYVNLPYVNYIAATAATYPTGIPTIMPIDRSFISAINLDVNALAGTAITFTPQQSNDDTGILASGVDVITTHLGQNTAGVTISAAGNYKILPDSRYFYCYASAGTAITSETISGCTGMLGQTAAIQNVSVTTNNVPVNLSQLAGSTPNTATLNGSTNKSVGVAMGTCVANTDAWPTSFAGAGRVNGPMVASAMGGGVSISADINLTVTTLGTATALVFILQESYDSGNTWNDIYSTAPITTSQHIRVPAIPIAGRRRWNMHSVGGTSTTVSAYITAQELPVVYPKTMQFIDIYNATNPTSSLINGVSVPTTLVSTSLNSYSANAIVEGCKTLTISGIFTGGTPTTAPVYTLQVSQDATNWISTACTMSPTAAGTFGATITNMCWRYARLIVTTASAGGTPYGVTYTAINGSL